MPPDLDDVVWQLDDDDTEPNVIVHPALEAFCLVEREPVEKPEIVIIERRHVERAIEILNEQKRRAAV